MNLRIHVKTLSKMLMSFYIKATIDVWISTLTKNKNISIVVMQLKVRSYVLNRVIKFKLVIADLLGFHICF